LKNIARENELGAGLGDRDLHGFNSEAPHWMCNECRENILSALGELVARGAPRYSRMCARQLVRYGCVH
jgi:hypothetical protein